MLSIEPIDVYENAAKFEFSCSFEGIPSNAQMTSYTIIINDVPIEDAIITFSNEYLLEGNFILDNLKSGTYYSTDALYGQISCEYVYWVEYPLYNEFGEQTGSYLEKEYGTDLQTTLFGHFFTHPGSWYWEDYISSGSVINSSLTDDIVNNWVNHLVALKNWEEQEWQTFAGDYDEETGVGYYVKAEEPIYLQWFNNCLRALNKQPITRENNNDIISLDNLKKLNIPSRKYLI